LIALVIFLLVPVIVSAGNNSSNTSSTVSNQSISGTGVVCGLDIDCEEPPKVVIEPGIAIDALGDDIVIDQPVELDIEELMKEVQEDVGVSSTKEGGFSKYPPEPTYDQYLKYHEDFGDPVQPYSPEEPCEPGSCEPSRIHEGYQFELRHGEAADQGFVNIFTGEVTVVDDPSLGFAYDREGSVYDTIGTPEAYVSIDDKPGSKYSTGIGFIYPGETKTPDWSYLFDETKSSGFAEAGSEGASEFTDSVVDQLQPYPFFGPTQSPSDSPIILDTEIKPWVSLEFTWLSGDDDSESDQDQYLSYDRVYGPWMLFSPEFGLGVNTNLMSFLLHGGVSLSVGSGRSNLDIDMGNHGYIGSIPKLGNTGETGFKGFNWIDDSKLKDDLIIQTTPQLVLEVD
jgi:hypothetical protein